MNRMAMGVKYAREEFAFSEAQKKLTSWVGCRKANEACAACEDVPCSLRSKAGCARKCRNLKERLPPH
jgi:hypothetical protein